MAPRSTIAQLPPEIRDALEAVLIARGFADYSAIAAEINARLAAAGVDATVSRSAVHRFGQQLEERIAALKRSTEVARTIAREVGDDEGALNDALVRLVQDRLFNVIDDLEVDPQKVDILKVGHMIADLGRAGIAQKKHQIAVKEKAARVAESVAKQVAKAGLSPERVDEIRREILGIGG